MMESVVVRAGGASHDDDVRAEAMGRARVEPRVRCVCVPQVDGSLLGVTRRLWRTGGVMAFWDGIGPKLARAVVNHAVTFLVFDNLCALWLRHALR